MSTQNQQTQGNGNINPNDPAFAAAVQQQMAAQAAQQQMAAQQPVQQFVPQQPQQPQYQMPVQFIPQPQQPQYQMPQQFIPQQFQPMPQQMMPPQMMQQQVPPQLLAAFQQFQQHQAAQQQMPMQQGWQQPQLPPVQNALAPVFQGAYGVQGQHGQQAQVVQQPYQIVQSQYGAGIAPHPTIMAELLRSAGYHKEAYALTNPGQPYDGSWIDETLSSNVSWGGLLATGAGMAFVAWLWSNREDNFLGQMFPSLTVAGAKKLR